MAAIFIPTNWNRNPGAIPVESQKEGPRVIFSPLTASGNVILDSVDLSKGALDRVSPPADVAANPKAEQKPEPVHFRSPLDLDRWMLKKWGARWLEWEPETLRAENLRCGASGDQCVEWAQICQLLHLSDGFWKDHSIFEKVVLAWSGDPVFFDRFQEPSPGQMAYAMTEIARLRNEHYADSVLSYISVVTHLAGVYVLPDPLDIAQDSANTLSGLHPDFIKAVRARWMALGASELPQATQESAEDIQMARMGAIRAYVQEKSK